MPFVYIPCNLGTCGYGGFETDISPLTHATTLLPVLFYIVLRFVCIFIVGSLNAAQTIVGKLAWYNIWNYQMSDSEILNLGCRDEGNIVNWGTLKVQGDGPNMHFEEFPCSGNII